MHALPPLRPHGPSIPSGLMKILPHEAGPKFLFEQHADMAKVFVVGLRSLIVQVKEVHCRTLHITTVSTSVWEEAWKSEGVEVSVRQFLERCGVSFGNFVGSGSRQSGSSNNNNNDDDNNNNNNTTSNNNSGSNNNNNNSSSNNNNEASGSGNDTGGGNGPSHQSPSQPSADSLPGNQLRILVHVQNECGEGFGEETKLTFAQKPEAMCSLQAGLDFLITRDDNLIPPLLQLELKINAEFLLLSQCMVQENGKTNHTVGVIHDDLQMSYHGDTKSAALLHQANIIDVYDLEVANKSSTSKASGIEVGGEASVMGGHPYVISGGGKLGAKRTRMSTTLAEKNEVRKVDALKNSAFTVDYNCRRRIHAADILSFAAAHLPPMNKLTSLEEAGLSLKKGEKISSSLGKSIRMSAVGEFFCAVGQVHVHTLELSREVGELEVSDRRSLLCRLTGKKAITKVCLATSKQTFKVELLLSHQIDFSLYGGKKIIWVAQSFESPAPTLIDM